MTEAAYIYDVVRMPRSRGKAEASLHEVEPINLVTTLLLADMRARLDVAWVCVDHRVNEHLDGRLSAEGAAAL